MKTGSRQGHPGAHDRRWRLSDEDVRIAVARRRQLVAEVLRTYLASHKCPCRWKQFVYWAGKEQGPGWQDEIQNHLVEAALKLRTFVKTPPSGPEYCLEAELHCTVCGSKWKYYLEEWRMMAFRRMLQRCDGDRGDAAAGALISACIAATVGFEPADGTPTLLPEEWAKYMLGKPFRTDPYRRYSKASR